MVIFNTAKINSHKRRLEMDIGGASATTGDKMFGFTKPSGMRDE